MKIKSIFISVMLLTITFISGCNTSPSSKPNQVVNGEDSSILTIYTTIFPIEDFTRKIGGKYVKVKSIYPAGADTHTFEPTIRTMMNIADSDLFIFNGAGLEPFIDKAKSSLTKEKVVMVEAANGIELLSDHDEHEHSEKNHSHDGAEHEEDSHENADSHEEDHHHHDKDPHIWLDPIHAETMAENIKNALIEAMPAAKKEFENNFQVVKQKIEQLDQELQSTIGDADHKEILVSHTSYGYWEHRYGLEQLSIIGLSPENEPSQKQLQTIIETVKEHDLSYIIYDQNPQTKVVDTVKKETGTTPVILHNLEYVTENDLKNKEDYFSLMSKNIETLKKVLTKSSK